MRGNEVDWPSSTSEKQAFLASNDGDFKIGTK